MEDRKVTNNHYYGDLGIGAFMLIFIIGSALVALILLAIKGVIVAWVILSVLVTVTLMVLGIMLTLAIQAQTHKQAEKRALIEQARFRDNVNENLAQYQLQAQVQLAQMKVETEARKALRSELDSYRRLPAPADEAGGFEFDEALYSELDEDVR